MKMNKYVNLCFALMCIVLTSASNYEPKKEESALSRVFNYFGLGRKGEAGPGPQNYYQPMYPQYGPCAMPSTTTTTTPAPAIPLCPYPFVPQPLPQVGQESSGFPIPGPVFPNPFPNGPNGMQGQGNNPMFPNPFQPQPFPPISDLSGGPYPRPYQPNPFEPQGNRPIQTPGVQPRPFNPNDPYNPNNKPYGNPNPNLPSSTAVELNPNSPAVGVLQPEIISPDPHGITVVEVQNPVYPPVNIVPVEPESPLIVQPSEERPERPVAIKPTEEGAELPVQVKPIDNQPDRPIAIKPIVENPERPEKIPPISPEVPVAVRPSIGTADEPEFVNNFPNLQQPHAISPQPIRPNNAYGVLPVLPLGPPFPLPTEGDQFGPPYGPNFGNQLGPDAPRPYGPRPYGPNGPVFPVPNGGQPFGPNGPVNGGETFGPNGPVNGVMPFRPLNNVPLKPFDSGKPFNPNGGNQINVLPPFLPLNGPNDDHLGPIGWNPFIPHEPFRPDGDNQILPDRPLRPTNNFGGPDDGNLFNVNPLGPNNGKPLGPIGANQINTKPFNPNEFDGENFGPSGIIPNRPNGGLPNRPNGELPFTPNGLIPNRPNGGLPNRPNGGLPNGPNGEVPFTPNGLIPNRPNGGLPNRPNDGLPNGPNGELPFTPNGLIPNRPNGGLPNRPNGGLPNGPNGGLPNGPNGGLPNGPNGGLPNGPNGGLPNGPNGGLPNGPNGGLPNGPNGEVPFTPNGIIPNRPNGGLPIGTDAGYPNRPLLPIDQDLTHGVKPYRPEDNPMPRPRPPGYPVQTEPINAGQCIAIPAVFVPPGFSIVKQPQGTCGPAPVAPCSMLEMLQRLRLRTFSTLIRLAGLEQLFIEGSDYTLFVPVDVAFELLPRWFLESLIADKKLLQNFLYTHFIQADVPLSSLGNEYLLLNKRPGSHRLRATIAFPDLDYPTVMIDAAKVLKGDILTTNGRLNIIDKVLKPNPPRNAREYLGDVADLKNFVDAVDAADLRPLLEGPDPITLFIPHNRGFSKSDLLKLSEDKKALQNFCKYHMVNGSYYSAGLQNGQYLTTNYLKEIKIGVANDGFTKYMSQINGYIKILKSDITTTNAVIHIIEDVISSAALFYSLEDSNEFGFEYEILKRNMNLSPQESKDEASSKQIS